MKRNILQIMPAEPGMKVRYLPTDNVEHTKTVLGWALVERMTEAGPETYIEGFIVNDIGDIVLISDETPHPHFIQERERVRAAHN